MARLVLLVIGFVVCAHAAPGYGGGNSNNVKHVNGAAEDVKDGKYGQYLSSGVGHGEAGSDVGNTPNSGADSESAGSGGDGSKDNAGNNHGISKDEGVSSDDRITPASGANYEGTGSGNEANIKERDNSNNAHVGKSDTYGNSGGSDKGTDKSKSNHGLGESSGNANIEDTKNTGRYRRQIRGQGNRGGRGGMGSGRVGNGGWGRGRFRRSESKSDDNSSDSEERSSESDEGTNTATDKHDIHGGSTSGKDADNRASYIGEKKGRYRRRAKSGGKGSSGKGGKHSGSGKCG